MADVKRSTDGLQPDEAESYDFTRVPDGDNDFVDDAGIIEFAKALAAPDPSPSNEDLTNPNNLPQAQSSRFITALNDWRPIRQRVKRKQRKRPRRGKDETREGYLYTLLKGPLLVTVFGWIIFLFVTYLLTRFYIYLYEHWVTWRGTRERLRQKLQGARNYEQWVKSAKELDTHLGNDKWKRPDDYAYYESKTIRRVRDHLKEYREKAENEEHDQAASKNGANGRKDKRDAIHELRKLLEACVKYNFVGVENPHLYSETYFGTKNVVQDYIDEVSASIELISRSEQLSREAKRDFFKQLHTNYGRSALCLSGGAAFAYYHFGVAKALLDADLLPDIITGTSGGALVAAMLCTRTNDELKRALIPALAHRITACHEGTFQWMRRWWKTGARFDSVDWACRCSWFTRGSMTFREAYIRTGRVLNVSCVPSDPHSPTILVNHLTSPDCVIWSAVLASAAVPGILNPIVLMKKVKFTDANGEQQERLEPYSFGHKWKDGSLRTDIPLRALNVHFNVNFSIVSQVNPHVNLFFFSSRGSVGRPVTHRKGRGWRGGYVGSAIEQYLKLDLTKWLKVLRHLELLPRPLGQDWSEIWLQKFSGTITIWPKAIPSDFYYILSDPSPHRLARMIHAGQLTTYSKLKFIGNHMKIERLIEKGRKATRPVRPRTDGLETVFSEDDLKGLLKQARRNKGGIDVATLLGGDGNTPLRELPAFTATPGTELPGLNIPRFEPDETDSEAIDDSDVPVTEESSPLQRVESPSIGQRLSGWWQSVTPSGSRASRPKLIQPNSDAKFGSATRTNSDRARNTPYSHHQANSMFELRAPVQQAKQQAWEEEQRRLEATYHYEEAQQRRQSSTFDELSRQSMVFFDDQDYNRETDGSVGATDEEGYSDEDDLQAEGKQRSEPMTRPEDEQAVVEEKIWDRQTRAAAAKDSSNSANSAKKRGKRGTKR